MVRIKQFFLINIAALILFTISILTVHISFNKFEIPPSIFLNISNGLYDNPTIINLSDNDPKGTNVSLYTIAYALYNNNSSFYLPVQIPTYARTSSQIMTDIEKASTIYKICGNQSSIKMNSCNIPAKINETISEISRGTGSSGDQNTFSIFSSKLAYVLTQGDTEVKILDIYGLHNKTEVKIFASDLLDTTTGNSIRYGNITFGNNKSNEIVLLNKGEISEILVHVHAPEAGFFSGNIILIGNNGTILTVPITVASKPSYLSTGATSLLNNLGPWSPLAFGLIVCLYYTIISLRASFDTSLIVLLLTYYRPYRQHFQH